MTTPQGPLTEQDRWLVRCNSLAMRAWYRFNSIRVDSPTSFAVVTEDQGGWPFDGLVFQLVGTAEHARDAFEAALRALAETKD